jgi:sarcosine oxidase delta subunit
MTPRPCPTCGRRTQHGVTLMSCPCHDARAIAYYTGRAEARWGRPRRHDADASDWLSRAYTRGYNAGIELVAGR